MEFESYLWLRYLLLFVLHLKLWGFWQGFSLWYWLLNLSSLIGATFDYLKTHRSMLSYYAICRQAPTLAYPISTAFPLFRPRYHQASNSVQVWSRPWLYQSRFLRTLSVSRPHTHGSPTFAPPASQLASWNGPTVAFAHFFPLPPLQYPQLSYVYCPSRRKSQRNGNCPWSNFGCVCGCRRLCWRRHDRKFHHRRKDRRVLEALAFTWSDRDECFTDWDA